MFDGENGEQPTSRLSVKTDQFEKSVHTLLTNKRTEHIANHRTLPSAKLQDYRSTSQLTTQTASLSINELKCLTC